MTAGCNHGFAICPKCDAHRQATIKHFLDELMHTLAVEHEVIDDATLLSMRDAYHRFDLEFPLDLTRKPR